MLGRLQQINTLQLAVNAAGGELWRGRSPGFGLQSISLIRVPSIIFINSPVRRLFFQSIVLRASDCIVDT